MDSDTRFVRFGPATFGPGMLGRRGGAAPWGASPSRLVLGRPSLVPPALALDVPSSWLHALPSSTVATAPSIDIDLTDLADETRSLSDWLTTFPLALVVVDPFTYESSWILDTAVRLFGEYAAADVRLAFLVTADVDGTRQFLGPLAAEALAFADPDRNLVRDLELETLPALVTIRQDGQLIGVAEVDLSAGDFILS